MQHNIETLLGVQQDPSLVDGQARFEAINPFQSFIVQAPAGSGKTALLTQRFLALLTQVEQPEHIVAMTFTKKAAAEMRDRIMGALNTGLLTCLPENAGLNDINTWQLAKRVLDVNAVKGWSLLENPNRLRIKTIDGLNSYLVAQMPLLSKMGAPSSISHQVENAYKEAVHLALKTEALAPAVSRLLSLVNGRFARAESLLMSMLQKRDQWMGALLPLSDEGARSALESAMESIVKSELRLQVVQLSSVRTALEEACSLADYAVQHQQPQLEALCGAWPLNDSLEDLPKWRVLADWLLTKENGIRKSINKNNGFIAGKGTPKEKKDQFLNVLATLREGVHATTIAESLAVLKTMPSPRYSETQWHDLQGLIELLRVCAAYLKVVFQSSGQADFIEIAQAASQSLGDELAPTDLAQQLDYQIQHLLVDEFQDTSSEQYQLICKLMAGWQVDDGRTLFIVGDPMQSIYRFREAEVGNFLKAWQGNLGSVASNVTLIPLQLHVNFRSCQGVVDWVNEHFKRVFPRDNNMAQGAVAYSESSAFHRDSVDEKHSVVTLPVTTYWALNRTESEEAEAVLTLIKQRLAEWDCTKNVSSNKNQSIALLGRTRSSLMPIARLLKQQQIPFRAIELEGLNERQEVQDVLALSRALLHLSDRAAWIALLRSPMVGLSLYDLYAVMGEQPYQSVWHYLMSLNLAEATELSETGKQQLAVCLPILQHAFERLGSVPFSVLVREVWLQLDGALTVENRVALDNVETFCQTLAEWDGEALDFQRLDTLTEKLFARADSSPASQCIELMTMHKSKGLEFDTVILPGLGRPPRHDDTELIAWFQFLDDSNLSEEGAQSERLVIAPMSQKGQDPSHLSTLLKRFEAQKQRYELGRLLYVAVTRAKQQLHLFGQMTFKESDDTEKEYSPANNSLLEALWPCVASDFNALIKRYEPPEEISTPYQSVRDIKENWPKVSRLTPQRTHFKEMLPSLKTEQFVMDVQQEGGKNFGVQHAEATAPYTETQGKTALLNTSVGNLVHAVLEQAVTEPACWALDNIIQQLAQRQVFYKRWLSQQGLTGTGAGEPLTQALERVTRSLHHAFHNPKIRWALNLTQAESLTQSATEYPLTSTDSKGEITHHVIDRTFIDEQGVRWIIDYKTSVFEGGGEEKLSETDFIQQQVKAYQSQLQRYGELFSQMETRSQQRVLYFSDLDRWEVL
jgi:ATP-dependent exoDNAse (exonuclease V) beta subunit